MKMKNPQGPRQLERGEIAEMAVDGTSVEKGSQRNKWSLFFFFLLGHPLICPRARGRRAAVLFLQSTRLTVLIVHRVCPYSV